MHISGKKKIVGKTSYGLWGSYSLPSGIFFLSLWLSWGSLSLIPRIPRPSWMKSRIWQQPHISCILTQVGPWVWLEKETRRRVKLQRGFISSSWFLSIAEFLSPLPTNTYLLGSWLILAVLCALTVVAMEMLSASMLSHLHLFLFSLQRASLPLHPLLYTQPGSRCNWGHQTPHLFKLFCHSAPSHTDSV